MGEMWRRCASCKADIDYAATYWVCSVSTCNRARTGMVFCSVSCWDAHLGFENHRQAWALERRAPEAGEASESAPPRPQSPRSPQPERRLLRPDRPSPRRSAPERDDLPRDILIVASKLKKYIAAASGLKTSDTVMEALSDRVRELCDQAIESARKHERKTVLDRDVRRRIP